MKPEHWFGLGFVACWALRWCFDWLIRKRDYYGRKIWRAGNYRFFEDL